MSQFLRLSPQPSALSTHQQDGILNNQRKSVWPFRCTYNHSVLGWPGRVRVMSDLMMLQHVAVRAFPPASRAGGPEKWQKWQFLGHISSIRTLV
jgi:hypothetical protein